jgi:hypothetical protein
MDTDWIIHYTVTRYMGDGLEVLVRAPIRGPVSISCRRTESDWDVPTLISAPESAKYSGELPTARAESLYERFALARIGAVPPAATTIDSDSHVLVFSGGLANRVEYQWSIALPECWAELAGIVDELSELAEELL